MMIKFTIKLVKTAADMPDSSLAVQQWRLGQLEHWDGDGLPNQGLAVGLVEGAQYTEKDILCKTVIIKAN